MDMYALNLLLLTEVLVSGLSADQPEDVVFADPGNSVNLICASDGTRGTRLVTWYRRRERDAWTAINNNSQKSSSWPEANITHLVIDNVTSQDFGRYYCSGFNGKTQVFEKGITLITGGISTSSSSIQLLTPLHPTTHPFPIPLACVVHVSTPQVYVIWNISGKHMKGRMIFWQKPNGTWITLSSISLSGNTWRIGEKVTCEVWFSSTPVIVHWETPQSLSSGVLISSQVKMSSTYWAWWIPTYKLFLVVAIYVYYIWKYEEF